MKILVFDTKSYDQQTFETVLPQFPQHTMTFEKADLSPATAVLAKGFDAVCAFVNSDLTHDTLTVLDNIGIRLVLLRCAGYNNVDLHAARSLNIRILRVPDYSPRAVAEHAMALALACNRRLYKAYNKVRENDFSLDGLIGSTFFGKTAGIVGTGKIGSAMCHICSGFGMEILAFDKFPDQSLTQIVNYVSLEELLSKSDLISLHCPLTAQTHHLICKDTIHKMKNGVILVNTSRGALVNTNDLIEGIRMHKFAGVGLDVYEEEAGNVFEDRSDQILSHSTTARLLSFPNVMITSHQGFFTKEALFAIAYTTLSNADLFLSGCFTHNEVL